MSKIEVKDIDSPSGESILTLGGTNSNTVNVGKSTSTTNVKGGTVNLGASGTNIVIPSGATLTNNGTTNFGKVLQVVQATKTDAFTTTSTSFVDITGLSANITPSSASSKVLVFMTIGLFNVAPIAFPKFKVVRDSTDVLVGSSNAQSSSYTVRDGGTGTGADSITTCNLDSPSTTSSTTYKVQCLTSAQTLYVNRWDGSADSYASTIILMEIAA